MIEGIHNRELYQKLNELNEKIVNLKQQITVEKEESNKYHQEYINIEEQIKFYKKQLENSNESIIEEEENEKGDEEESDDKLVYLSLKKRLKEINNKLSLVGSFPNKKPIEKCEPISFQCICVILLDRFPIKNPIDDGITLKYQTFRIYHETNVFQILNACLELWNLKEINSNNLYKLSYIDNEKIDDLNEGIVIASFLKQKKELKNARFVLYPKVDKNPFEIIKELETFYQENHAIPNSLSDNFDNFTQNFVGMSKYIKLRYQELKDEEENNKIFFEEDEKILFLKKIKSFAALGLYIILFVLFFIFSILSLCSMKNPFQTYHEVEEIRNRFNNNFNNISLNPSFIQSSANIRNSILSIFNDFYYDFNDERFNKMPLVVVSKARISFFESTIHNCQKDYIKFYKKLYGHEPTCYNTYYKYDSDTYKGYYSSYIKESKYINKTGCNDSNANETYFIYTNEKSPYSNIENKHIDNNYIKNCSDLEKYFEIFFQGWHLTPIEIDDLSIKGELGNYGSHPVNIFFSVNFINKNVLNEALKLLTHDKDEIYDYFSPTNQSACAVTMTVYNIFTKHYFYISFLYEFSLSTGNTFPKIDIIPFIPDLSRTKGGKTIKYLDVFRLLLIILLSLITIYQFYVTLTQKNKKTQFNIGKHFKKESFISAFLSMEIIIDLTDFIIFLILFVKKRNHLYQNMVKNGELSYENQFYELNTIEYQKIAMEYQTVLQLESLLIILLLFRFLVFFNENSRIKKYFKFLRLSLYKVYPYFIFYLFFCFIFAIFAQQIWGSYDSNFKYYNESFLSIIEFSISHVQKVFQKNNIWDIYIAVFTFMFYVIIIYFIMNTFFGIYFESYRLTNLKHGVGYDSRLLSKIVKKYNENSPIERQISGDTELAKLK